MSHRILMPGAVAVMVVVFAWLSIGIAEAQTRKGAIHAQPPNQCQVAPDGQCFCGTPWWTGTGRQIPCRREFMRQPPAPDPIGGDPSCRCPSPSAARATSGQQKAAARTDAGTGDACPCDPQPPDEPCPVVASAPPLHPWVATSTTRTIPSPYLRLVAFDGEHTVLRRGEPFTLAQATDAQGAKLVIANKPMVETPKNYLCTIRFLTVPGTSPNGRDQNDPVFKAGKDTAAIRALEDPLRRQIFDAMNRNPARQFVFASRKHAEQNFDMRVATMQFMDSIDQRCEYYGGGNDPVIYSTYWKVTIIRDPPTTGIAIGNLIETMPGKSPHSAIAAIAAKPTDPKMKHRIECLAALEFSILFGADQAMNEPSRFDTLHAAGLRMIGVPWNVPGMSIYEHIDFVTTNIQVAAMVPGDWAYLRNKPDYESLAHKGAYWKGENALYMGRYKMNGLWKEYGKAEPPRFSGFGLMNHTESELRNRLKDEYTIDIPGGVITDQDIEWTLHGHLKVGD